jgi:hypothetical protein
MPDRLAALNELIAELEAEQKRPGGDTIAAWRHLMDLRRESGPTSRPGSAAGSRRSSAWWRRPSKRPGTPRRASTGRG